MISDLKFALRQLVKSPGFTVTAIITLALGIGANAVVFSVLNALVLRPVNVPHGENLYMVQRAFARGSTPSQSYPDYLDLRDRNHTFSSIMAFNIVGPVGVDAGAIHRQRGPIWPAAITSTRSMYSPSSAAFITPLTSMATTARPMWC